MKDLPKAREFYLKAQSISPDDARVRALLQGLEREAAGAE